MTPAARRFDEWIRGRFVEYNTTLEEHYFSSGNPAEVEGVGDDLKQTLVEEKYITKVPTDPITQSADTWETVFAIPDERDISLEPGIEDVRSGAPGTGMDGTAYADW